MSQNYVNVRVKKDVHDELAKLGNLQSNYSDVISNLIKSAKKDSGK